MSMAITYRSNHDDFLKHYQIGSKKIVVRSLQINDRVEVEGTGKGIPASHLDKIFTPFFTSKQGGKGPWFGLSMGCGIIENTGGSYG